MLEQRVAAALGGLHHLPVVLAAQGQPVRAADPAAKEPLDRAGDLRAGSASGASPSGSCPCGDASAMPVIASGQP